MQDGLTRNWVKKMHRKGVFENYSVSGFQYESESWEIGWHITAWPAHGPIHDYWVSGKEFYSMRIHYDYNFTNRTLIEIFGAITDLGSEEKNAVMLAIAKWEGLEEQRAEVQNPGAPSV
jgi:hypothetical protein